MELDTLLNYTIKGNIVEKTLVKTLTLDFSIILFVV